MFTGGTNYNGQSGAAAIVINKANATVTVNGYTGTYDAAAHGATGSVVGVAGDASAAGSALNLGASFTDAPGGTANWVFTGGTNYNDKTGTAAIVINKANAAITVTPYNVSYDTLAHTATATVVGVDAGGTAAGTSINLAGTTHTVAGTFVDSWSFSGGTNYNNASGTVTDRISARSATVNYIGQTVWTTSGSSSTTAQVTLTASMQDATGVALAGATVDFIDALTGKVLASGVKVAAVSGVPGAGTANTVVTLSTGQYGSESYEILVKLTGNYDNTTQALADKTATVVVSKPATFNSIIGGGTIMDTAATTVAGTYASPQAVVYSVGLQYNKSLTNLQGQIKLSIDQADGSVIVIKSNSLSSMTVSTITGGKQSTVYAKASVSRINLDGSITTLEGGATLRMDVLDMTTGADSIGFTVLSSKDSSLLYSNDWFYDTVTKTWKTRAQALAGGSMITIG